MHHSDDLPEVFQGFAGAFGQIKGFPVTEQALDEPFEFLRARLTEMLESSDVRSGRPPH